MACRRERVQTNYQNISISSQVGPGNMLSSPLVLTQDRTLNMRVSSHEPQRQLSHEIVVNQTLQPHVAHLLRWPSPPGISDPQRTRTVRYDR